MRLTFLGRTGLRVSELCLGTMTFGTEFGWGADEPTSRAIFETFVEAGGNFFDTANSYTRGSSEHLLGRFLKGQRDRFVVASKYTISPDHRPKRGRQPPQEPGQCTRGKPAAPRHRLS